MTGGSSPGPEWVAEHEVSPARAGQLVAEQFPELAGARVEALAEGWDNTVHVVAGTWAFRFPRRQVALAGVEREISLLPRLASLPPLPVPVPALVG
ncbi:MAG: phosphotransferase, partial [Actinomycetes bacterium]